MTGETISDSAECYAGLSVRFESSAAQVVCGLRLRCIVVVKFSRWRRRVEKMSKFCPLFREVLALTCAAFQRQVK